MKELALQWLDSKSLIDVEVEDFDFVIHLLEDFEDSNNFEFDDDEIIDVVSEYQRRFFVNKLANKK